jgi:2-keto-4-pentenoate hydratase/2-oxohepta-3-ene-1,7-dioic acid hydratase in catechol pathway
MKLAQFKTKTSDAGRLGLLAEEKVIDLAALAVAVNQAGGEVPAWLPGVTQMLEIIHRGDEALTTIQALVDEAQSHHITAVEPLAFALDAIDFLPAVQAGKILAIGRNYEDHALEGGSEPPAAPLIFNKLINSLSAHNAPIVLPAISSQVDYEAELAVVIGRRAKHVSEAEALDYIFGYTLINDVSARDLQFGDGQWVRGKGLDGFAPLGPFITTRADIPDVQALNIEGRLNGEIMQTSNTGKMIFKIAYLVSYISQGITLEPGDCIATGTPEGVGIFRKPPVLLKAGDVYEVTVENLGTLRNPVISE